MGDTGRASVGMWKVYCTHCGHGNLSEDTRCARCGTPLCVSAGWHQAGVLPLDVSTASLTAADALAGHDERLPGDTGELSVVLAPDTGLLVITRGPDAGNRLLLDADVVTVGRHPDSGIVLEDVTVSRRHAEILRRRGAFMLRDVGSLNGTYVNGESVERAALSSGDELRIGIYVFAFLAAGDRRPERTRQW